MATVLLAFTVGASSGAAAVSGASANASHADTSSHDQSRIVSVSISGEVTAARTTYLWMSEPATVTVRFDAGRHPDHGYAVCVIVDAGNDTGSQCRRFSPAELDGYRRLDGSYRVRLVFDPWPVNKSVKQNVSVSLARETANRTAQVDRVSTTARPMRPSGDVDGDKLSNQDELAKGTNVTDTDTDDDGLTDGAEVTEYGTDPLTPDTDDDGLRDGQEIQLGTDPTKADSDNDGLQDGEEVDVHGTDPTKADSDDDGLQDGAEVHHGTDPLAIDTDDDGLTDGVEVNVYGTDPTMADTDGDGLSDGLEIRVGMNPANPLFPFLLVAILAIGAAITAGAWYRRTDRVDVLQIPGFGRNRQSDPTTTAKDDRQPPSEVAGDGETLTDEERVIRLLKEADDRVKQVQIVELTGWSKAKVSRVLTRMEEEGSISRVRMGRENLVFLEGHVPEEMTSPFEDSK